MKTNLFMSLVYFMMAFIWKFIVTAPAEADAFVVCLFVFLGLYRFRQAMEKV